MNSFTTLFSVHFETRHFKDDASKRGEPALQSCQEAPQLAVLLLRLVRGCHESHSRLCRKQHDRIILHFLRFIEELASRCVQAHSITLELPRCALEGFESWQLGKELYYIYYIYIYNHQVGHRGSRSCIKVAVDQDRRAWGRVALPGHKPGVDQPWLGRLGEGVWLLKNPKHPMTPRNITDDVSKKELHCYRMEQQSKWPN